MDDDDLAWHPSGWSPVTVGVEREVVGFTRLREDRADRFMISRPLKGSDIGAFTLRGMAVKNALPDSQWYAWHIDDGSPYHMPNFFPI